MSEKNIVNVATELYRFDENDGIYVVAAKCNECGAEFFPKEHYCQNCLGEDLAELPLPKEGTIYSFTTVVTAPAGFVGPYNVGFVDLGDFRIYGMIRGENPQIGNKVKVEYGVIRETEEAIEKGYIYTLAEVVK